MRSAAHRVRALDWQATFFVTGLADSIVKDSAYEATQRRAMQRAAREAVREK